MPQFKQVIPHYTPEERNDTQDQLNAHLKLALCKALASINKDADGMRARFVDGAEGLQCLCQLLVQNAGGIIAERDVEDTVSNLYTLTEIAADSLVVQAIADIKSIYAAHCANVTLVNASVSQQVAPVSYGDLNALLAGLDVAPISPAPPEQPGASYQELTKEACYSASADSTKGLASGGEMLVIVRSVYKEVASLAIRATDSLTLIGLLGLCEQLELNIKRGVDITERVIDDEVAKIDGLAGATSTKAYIDRLKGACRPEQAAKDKLVSALDAYISKRSEDRDSSGKTKEYSHFRIFRSWNSLSQNSFTGEKEAVEVLKKALLGNGSAEELRKCLPTLNSGGLATTLNPLIQDGTLLRAVGGGSFSGSKVTIGNFVDILTKSNGAQLHNN